jgi:GT2 family glycosyltransferase
MSRGVNSTKYAFVVLHYYDLESTVRCIESIQEHVDAGLYRIIVVDNGSPNGTGHQLDKLYKKSIDVDVVISGENLGFARGHNIGFLYAKSKLNPDFILLLNNDTVMTQDDFCKRIDKEYHRSGFAVLGPKIKLEHGGYESYSSKPIALAELRKNIFINRIKLGLAMLGVYQLLLSMKKAMVQSKAQVGLSRSEMVVLHGSCLIFSRRYIDKFDGLDARTFMYSEEQFLYWRIKNNNLLSVFNPDIEIYHASDVATKKSLKTTGRVNKFILSNQIRSDKILIKDLAMSEVKHGKVDA